MTQKKKLTTSNHKFIVEQVEKLTVYVHGDLNPDLYSAVTRYSQGYLKINPGVTKTNLSRIKDLRSGEVELLEIIDKLLNAIPREKKFMIVFRR